MSEKLTSRQDLLDMYERVRGLVDNKINYDPDTKRVISVCSCTGCASQESLELVAKLNEIIAQRGLQDRIHADITGCFGFCARGPIVKIYPDNIFYVQVHEEHAESIIDSIVNNTVVDELLYKITPREHAKHQNDIPFYGKQYRIALHKAGLINPENFAECIATRGYQALAKVLFDMNPIQVIDEVTKSGLRGRGGAGFPTGKKWSFARASNSDKKYIICNADEGDPGAFMDRSILEGDPHSVLEAMAIAGYSIGANKGYIYVRAEYPIAVHRFDIAIKQAREYGL